MTFDEWASKGLIYPVCGYFTEADAKAAFQAGAASRDDEVATLRELKQLYQTERDQLRKQVALLRETVISAKRMIAHPDNIAILEKALADTEPKK